MRRPKSLAWFLLLLGPWPCRAQEALTLEQALTEARAANVRLPVAAAGVSLGAARVLEAERRSYPQVFVLGRLRAIPPSVHYDLSMSVSEDRLQIAATQALYEGGELQANVQAAEGRLRSARLAYRVAEADLAEQVRMQFAAVLSAASEIAARREGLSRLDGYLTLVRQRRASGQGLQADVLRTEVRAYTEQAALAAARRTADEARVELNVLMGRDPLGPLALAPLPEPADLDIPGDSPWLRVPDLAQAAAEQAALEAEIEVTVAARRPHLEANADAGLLGPGIFPVPGVNGPWERLRNDLGASIGIDLTWKFWDGGTYEAQAEQAHLAVTQAARTLAAARSQAHLSFARAGTDLRADLEELRLNSRQVPVARDAYLLAESTYRGGAGTSLEVLDAFSSWVGARVAVATALLAYRVDEATLLRWSGP